MTSKYARFFKRKFDQVEEKHLYYSSLSHKRALEGSRTAIQWERGFFLMGYNNNSYRVIPIKKFSPIMIAIPLLSRALFVAEDNRGCALFLHDDPHLPMLQEGGGQGDKH